MGKSKITYFWKLLQPWVSKLLEAYSEFMKLSEYQRSRSFIDLDQRSLRFQS